MYKLLLLCLPLLASDLKYRWEVFSTSPISNSKVYTINEDSLGNRWFGTRNGLFRFDPSEAWTYYSVENTNNELLSDTIYDVEVDRFGRVWIATARGLNSFRFNRFESYTVENTDGQLPHNRVLALSFDKYNFIWLGTLNGFASFDGSLLWQNYTQQMSSRIPYVDVRAIEVTQDDIVWLGTSGGLVRFHNYEYTCLDVQNTNGNLAGNYITSLSIDSKGDLWIGTSDGVSVLSGDKWSKKYTKEIEGWLGNLVYSLEPVGGGMLVALRGGIVFVEETGRFQVFDKYRTHYGINSHRVFSIMKDKENILWVGTRDGLSRRYPLF